MEELRRGLYEIAGAGGLPDSAALRSDLEAGLDVLRSEGPPRRPLDAANRPGGLVYLREDLPTVIVPDVHARVDLVLSVLELDLGPWGLDEELLSALQGKRAQLLFLGDYVHAEARAATRWLEAFEEFQDSYQEHASMDAEMTESLTVLRLMARLRHALPEVVHCLKGNHENIANEYRDGNIPFGKFAYEGAMVADYMRRFYPSVFDTVYEFEKALPLVAVGAGFLAGHSEPARPFTKEEIINYRSDGEVVAGLTWTANDAAAPGSVEGMLDTLLQPATRNRSLYFGGHRPISGLYNLRAEGRYVQLHNPERYLAAVVPADRPFELENDVVEIPSTEVAAHG